MRSGQPMKIGTLSLKNKMILAPLAGITNLPFRLINRNFGVGLTFTEMISANGLIRGMKKTMHYLEFHSDDRPLGVQIFGSDPAVLAEAAKIMTDLGADLVDINMGCPVRKVVKTGAGAALMKDPQRIAAILKAVRKGTCLPLTVKMRAGWKPQSINMLEVAKIAEDAGVDAVIVHPRTADQGFGGTADWSLIEQVKGQVSIPVIGNGDIKKGEDAARMMRMTGCDAVMVGRGCLGNPWIFHQIDACLQGRIDPPPPSLAQRERMIRRHLTLELAAAGDRLGLKAFRKHLLWYTKGLKGGSSFRQMIGTVEDKTLLLDKLHAFIASLSLDPEGGGDVDHESDK
jgi:tRNA-dihydrouridine synthase B